MAHQSSRKFPNFCLLLGRQLSSCFSCRPTWRQRFLQLQTQGVWICAYLCLHLPPPRHPCLEMLQLSPLLQPRTVGNFLWFPLSHTSRAQLTCLPLASPVTWTFFGPLLSQAITHFNIGRRTLCPPSFPKSSKFTNTHFAAERIKRAVKGQEKHKEWHKWNECTPKARFRQWRKHAWKKMKENLRLTSNNNNKNKHK